MHFTSLTRNLFPTLLIVALLSCCAALGLSSCSKKASAAIIGKWQVQGSKDRIEFRKDGTVIISQDITAGPPGNTRTFEQETTSKYAFSDGNHMNWEISTGDTNQPINSISCEVHIIGDKMSMAMIAPGDHQQHQMSFKRLE